MRKALNCILVVEGGDREEESVGWVAANAWVSTSYGFTDFDVERSGPRDELRRETLGTG